MRRKKADKSRGQGSGRDVGWGGEAGTAARQFVRLPFKLWPERAFSHKWRVPAQVLRARYQGAEGAVR